MQKDKPELKFGELTKQLTDDWKAISEKEKKKYEDLASADRSRYEKECEEKGLSKKKADDGPKKPMSSFFLFSADMREKYKKTHPDLKFGDTAKKVAEEWKKADEKTKEKYEKKAKEDRERYEKEKAAMDDKTAASSEAGGSKAKKGAKPVKKTKKDTDADEEGSNDDDDDDEGEDE